MDIIMFNVIKKDLELVNENDVITKLYELELEVPTIDCIKKYITKHKSDKKNKKENDVIKIVKFFTDGESIENGIKKIKETLSKINNKIPLYDIYTENLYLVNRNDIYDKVIKEYRRFPSRELLETLEKRKKDIDNKLKEIDMSDDKNFLDTTNLQDINKDLYQSYQYGKLLIRTQRKIYLCLKFMQSFDLSILYDTYVNTMYSYSNQLGKSLTLCQRPSFAYQFKHIKPYYTRTEIIKLALNIGIVKDDLTYYDEKKVSELCKVIGENDIKSIVLLDHQIHIIKNKMIGLVQYYSLQGSYFMNQYLRNQVDYNCKNDVLESLITPMWKLILDAPEFDKQYIVYRFIQDDSFLSSIKIGDIYTEKGFMSTTRDPFYKQKEYVFGWILMKIKLPRNVKGCALCIEPISFFHDEQEIILPPNSQFKLLRKDDKSIYYHTDKSISDKLRTMYEFELIGKTTIQLPERPKYSVTDPIVDFLKIDKISSITIEEKIRHFTDQYVNKMGYFSSIIGTKQIDIKSEWYDSSSVYRDYYATQTKNGYSIYALCNNHLLFIIELGEQYNVPYMYVNYHIKYSTMERDKMIGSENFLKFVASIAYYFDVPNVVLYTDYISCDYMSPIDEHKYVKFYGGTYCVDFYEYLKYGKKKYSDIGVLNIELIPKFKYHQLDVLKKINPDDVLTKTDARNTDDRLYQMYKKVYKTFTPDINDTFANFYIQINENQCFMLGELIDKLAKIPQFITDNPFQHDYYIFNSLAFLYNRGFIKYMPMSINNLPIETINIKNKSGSMNRYRITTEQQRR